MKKIASLYIFHCKVKKILILECGFHLHNKLTIVLNHEISFQVGIIYLFFLHEIFFFQPFYGHNFIFINIIFTGYNIFSQPHLSKCTSPYHTIQLIIVQSILYPMYSFIYHLTSHNILDDLPHILAPRLN